MDGKRGPLLSWASPFLLPHASKLAHNGLCGMFREGGGSNCGACTEQELYTHFYLCRLLTLTLLITCATTLQISKTAAFVGRATLVLEKIMVLCGER